MWRKECYLPPNKESYREEQPSQNRTKGDSMKDQTQGEEQKRTHTQAFERQNKHRITMTYRSVLTVRAWPQRETNQRGYKNEGQ